MSTKKTRRGRPKGTGIDDSASLIRIAALIAGHPDLKPTTAIRHLGITEPSVIRRLRDKFKVFSQKQLSQKQAQESQPAAREPLIIGGLLRQDHNSATQASDENRVSRHPLPGRPETPQSPSFSLGMQKLAPEIRY